MQAPPDPAARWRGAATALMTSALAVGAHGVADGDPPSGAGVALLAVLAVTIGAVAATGGRSVAATGGRSAADTARRSAADTGGTTVAAKSGRAPGRTILLAILASGQIIGHLVLAAAGHHHGAAWGAPAAPMIAAHAVAVVAGALLIAGADRLFRALSTAVRGVAGLHHPLAAAATSPVVAGDQPHQAMLLLAASVSHRGPPASPPS